jgi:hypothetical protein
VEEYLTGLRAGRGIVHGEHGRYLKLTADIFFFAGALLKEKPWCAPLVIAAVLIPAVTAAHWFNEIRFCKQWMARLEHAETEPRMIWDIDSAFKANWAN